ncbi:hypothetical protein [Actinomadura sp. 6N118]|uniref:hypothetical protein n=1 Tax=Actinomadura sp. 6N118 TaxID=3375151 RepID=UPI00379A6968
MKLCKAVTVLAVCMALPLATSCGGKAPEATGSAPSKASGQAAAAGAGPAAAASIEQLAARMGCVPQPRGGKAADYRQAICATTAGKYVINTFDTAKGQQEWLEYSKMYGGTYLVGTRWIVVSSPQLPTPLRTKLGGQLQSPRTNRN